MSTKRDDILEAALRLFARHGFDGTTMPELARAAGVGAGTIYRHFDSKEALVNALYRHWKQRIMLDVYAVLPQDEPWRARFRLLWGRLFDFARAHPDAMSFLDLHHHGDYLDPESREVEHRSIALLVQLVVLAQAEEVLAPVPPLTLLAMLYGSFLGVFRASLEGALDLDDATVALTEERAWALIRR